MIQRFNPNYLAYAIEANLWPLEDPAGLMSTAEFLAEIYFTLKSEFPGLPIFLTLIMENCIWLPDSWASFTVVNEFEDFDQPFIAPGFYFC